MVDPLTVNVITKTPFPLLPVRMSPGHCGTVGIVPPKYVAQVGDAGFAVKPVGTGPYKFVEWVKDDRLVLEAYKDYHRGPRPRSTGWSSGPSPSSRRAWPRSCPDRRTS